MNPDKEFELAFSLMTVIQERRWRLFRKHRNKSLVARIEGVRRQTIQGSLKGGRRRAEKEKKFLPL